MADDGKKKPSLEEWQKRGSIKGDENVIKRETKAIPPKTKN
jgi:hypothetical protein